MNKAEFFDQYNKLRRKFPYIGIISMGNENCEYVDNTFRSSNCYYVFNSAEMHDCLYCEDGFKEDSDLDCAFGINCGFNCECVDMADSQNCYYSQSFARCYNLWYCYYCDDCHDCFGCSNLSNKSFCAFNVQYTEAEYKALLPKLKVMPKEEVLAKRKEITRKLPQLYAEHVDTVNSDYCAYAYFLNNCYYCFDCANDQDSGYLATSYESKDCWDGRYVVRGEQCCECNDIDDSYNCYNVQDSSRCFDSYFLEDCSDCHDCFGCVKLDHKSYCILNVQYTKEEYEAMLPALKKMLSETA